MHQLVLQLVQPLLGLLPLGKVPDEAGVEPRARAVHLADGQLHREGGAVLALADHHPADADDPPLTGPGIAVEIAVMLLTVRLRHQDPHIAADGVLGGIAEQALGGLAEGLDRPLVVDHHHCVGHGLEDGPKVILPRHQLRGRPLALDQGAPSALAHQARNRAHEYEDDAAHDGLGEQLTRRSGPEHAERQAEQCAGGPGRAAAIDADGHDRRSEQQIGRISRRRLVEEQRDRAGDRHQRQAQDRPGRGVRRPGTAGQQIGEGHRRGPAPPAVPAAAPLHIRSPEPPPA